MKVSAITKIDINHGVGVNKGVNRNAGITFTGRTESPYNASSCGGYNPAVPEGATPNYYGARPEWNTKIYVAAPFEIIPEEAYRTHDFTVRTDLRFSDIKRVVFSDNYPEESMNSYERRKVLMNPKGFVRNAEEENEFLSDFINKTAENNKNELENLNKSIDSGASIWSIGSGEASCIEKSVMLRNAKEAKLAAEERLELLKELRSYTFERDHNWAGVRRTLPPEETAKFNKKIEFCLKRLENLYKAKYPHWL